MARKRSESGEVMDKLSHFFGLIIVRDTLIVSNMSPVVTIVKDRVVNFQR
jgi:hypothetical protein